MKIAPHGHAKALVLTALVAVTASGEEIVANRLWQRYVAQPGDTNLVYFGGWSRARAVTHPTYSVFLDVYYADGTQKWGVEAPFSQGTHGWEMSSRVFVPEKPIKELQFHAIARGGGGEAEFRDFFFRRETREGELLRVRERTLRPLAKGGEREVTYFDGKGEASRIEPASDAPELAFPSSVAASRSVVWTADSMTRVTPLTFPTADSPRSLRLELARRERESAQVLVSTADDVEWRQGTVAIGPLVDAHGARLRGDVSWQRVGYLARQTGFEIHPRGTDLRERWLPDPLLPPAPFRVRKGSTQALWITVRAAPDATPGTYHGKITLAERGVTMATVPIEVKVRNFALPETFGLPTAIAVMDGFLRPRYAARMREMRRRAWDIMLDHRLNADDITRTEPPAIEDLLYARTRGMNHFTILNIVRAPKPGSNEKWKLVDSPESSFSDEFYAEFTSRLRPYVEELRRHNLVRYASLYGFDEREHAYYEGMDRMWRKLKRDFPDVKVMTTAYMYRDYVNNPTNSPYLISLDQQCPCTPSWRSEATETYRKAGKEVWWYTCCGPGAPYANMASYEHPTIEGRLLLGFMTHCFGADGYLYWHVNFWDEKRQPNLDAGDTFFPKWETSNALKCPGDGILLYPGDDDIYPSIRLAEMRDGVEDWEWLAAATRKCGKARVDAVSKRLVRSLTDFTRDPAELRAARREIGDMIEGREQQDSGK